MGEPTYSLEEIAKMHEEWHRFDDREGGCIGPKGCAFAWLFARIAALLAENKQLRESIDAQHDHGDSERACVPCVIYAAYELRTALARSAKGAPP